MKFSPCGTLFALYFVDIQTIRVFSTETEDGIMDLEQFVSDIEQQKFVVNYGQSFDHNVRNGETSQEKASKQDANKILGESGGQDQPSHIETIDFDQQLKFLFGYGGTRFFLLNLEDG